MTTNTIKRDSNFELLRIICMVMIIMGHISGAHRGIMDFQNLSYWVDFLIMPFVCVAVNSFVLISGYWGIKFNLRKLLKLNLQTFFYSVVILLFSIFIGWHMFSNTKDIGFFIPVFSRKYWFITTYYALCLLSPILNLFSTRLSKKEYQATLLLGFLLFYLWPTGSFLINTGQLVDDAGYGIVNFIYLYLLGRYIRLYNVGKNIKAHYFLLGYICCGFICFGLQLALSLFLNFEFTSWQSYNTIFIIGGSVCLFLYFSRINIQSSIINNLAKYCLAVYLIHTGPFLLESLCAEIGLKEFPGIHYVVLLFFAPIMIYLLCVLIEKIRILIFGKIEDYLIDRVCRLRIFIRIQNFMNEITLK